MDAELVDGLRDDALEGWNEEVVKLVEEHTVVDALGVDDVVVGVVVGFEVDEEEQDLIELLGNDDGADELVMIGVVVGVIGDDVMAVIEVKAVEDDLED